MKVATLHITLFLLISFFSVATADEVSQGINGVIPKGTTWDEWQDQVLKKYSVTPKWIWPFSLLQQEIGFSGWRTCSGSCLGDVFPYGPDPECNPCELDETLSNCAITPYPGISMADPYNSVLTYCSGIDGLLTPEWTKTCYCQGPDIPDSEGDEGSDGGSCTPIAGYDGCYYQEWWYNDAYATCKIHFTNPTGIYKDGYYVGGYYIDYAFSSSDDEYLYYSVDSDCDINGCDNYIRTLSDSGRIYLTQNAGDTFSGPVHIVGYAYDLETNGEAWTTCAVKWNNIAEVKSVECYDDTDCSATQRCDKSGDWEMWNCYEYTETCGNGECGVGEDFSNCREDCVGHACYGEVSGTCDNVFDYNYSTYSLCRRYGYGCSMTYTESVTNNEPWIYYKTRDSGAGGWVIKCETASNGLNTLYLSRGGIENGFLAVPTDCVINGKVNIQVIGSHYNYLGDFVFDVDVRSEQCYSDDDCDDFIEQPLFYVCKDGDVKYTYYESNCDWGVNRMRCQQGSIAYAIVEECEYGCDSSTTTCFTEPQALIYVKLTIQVQNTDNKALNFELSSISPAVFETSLAGNQPQTVLPGEYANWTTELISLDDIEIGEEFSVSISGSGEYRNTVSKTGTATPKH